MKVRKGRVEFRGGQPRGGKGRGVDTCMEVDGRVGERRGNIYISKRISTWAGSTTIFSDYVT